MLKKILILLTTLFFFQQTFAFNIQQAVNERNNNITLTKAWYSFVDGFIKKNFYNNQASLKQVRQDLGKIKKLVWWNKSLYYLILWMLKTETNITPVWWLKAWEYFNAKWGFLYPWLYVKCRDNKELPIWVWKVSKSNKWFDVSKSVYKNYKWNRRGYLSQFVAFCEFRAILPTQKEKDFYDNWKASYAGAIWLFQFLPLNITKKLWLEKNYKQWDIFTVNWYAKAIYNFLQYNTFKYNFKSPENLEKCTNYNSNKYPECKNLRERIYWYNHSTQYINNVIKNAVKIWEMNKSWIFTSPLNNFWFYPKNTNYVIKLKNALTIITQWFHFSRNRWHPAIDIAPILFGVDYQNRINFMNKNNLEEIWNSNKTANCYFMNYWDNKESWFIKKTW